MVNIPGNILEGGGQILRTAIALSAIMNEPVRISNIRAKRTKSGLRAQHLSAVKYVAALSNANVEGLEIGSKEISFIPDSIKGGSFNIDIGTAGSISLLLQALMPVTAFAANDVILSIRGGTNNPRAPPIEYLQEVFLPAISRMGFEGLIDLFRRGLYPKGGGLVKGEFKPLLQLKSIQIVDFEGVDSIFGISYSSRLKSNIVERIAKSAKRVLTMSGYNDVKIDLESLKPSDRKCAFDRGCGIILFAKLKSGAILGADSLGRIDKTAEKVGEDVALLIISELKKKSPVDSHLADQLILYMGLAEGESRIKITNLSLHTLTNIEICERILGIKYTVKKGIDKTAEIRCSGIALRNKFK